MSQIITQGVGYLALLLVLLSFQNNKRSRILALMLTGIILFVLHYALLGAWTGSVMNLLEAAVVYVSHQKETKKWAKSKLWLYMFVLSFVVAGLIFSKRLIDYLPVVGQIVGTIAIWQKNPRNIRMLMLTPRPLWFFYNLVVGSYAGMAAEIFIFLSVATGIVRFDILGKNSKQGKE